MKKNDIASLILIALSSVIVAFIVTQTIFDGVAVEEVKVKKIERIDASVVEPSTKIFNENAINPTVEVQIDSGSE